MDRPKYARRHTRLSFISTRSFVRRILGFMLGLSVALSSIVFGFAKPAAAASRLAPPGPAVPR